MSFNNSELEPSLTFAKQLIGKAPSTDSSLKSFVVITGIPDEASASLKTQIQTHQDLGWKWIDFRAVSLNGEPAESLLDLKARGDEGEVCMEPHLPSTSSEEQCANYLEYGRRLVALWNGLD